MTARTWTGETTRRGLRQRAAEAANAAAVEDACWVRRRNEHLATEYQLQTCRLAGDVLGEDVAPEAVAVSYREDGLPDAASLEVDGIPFALRVRPPLDAGRMPTYHLHLRVPCPMEGCDRLVAGPEVASLVDLGRYLAVPPGGLSDELCTACSAELLDGEERETA